MCGISGYLCLQGEAEDAAALLRMNRAVAHRGPDDDGFTLISARGEARDFSGDVSLPEGARLETLRGGVLPPHRIGLGHRRFSILDVSAHGHQPLWSPGREVCVAFNGEIYNYRELREELAAAGHRFAGTGDTEVLAAAFLRWGEDCFRRFNGFWAVALYDARRDALLFSRDRIGKAPLYWIRRGGRLWFSSEIKGLIAGLETSALPLDGDAVRRFARHGRRDLGGGTMYADIRTFPRASWAWIGKDGGFAETAYWRLPESRAAETGATGPTGEGAGGDRRPGVDAREAVAGFRDILSDAVRLRLRSDVPVGVELSGGMDSSAIAALAATALGDGPRNPLQAFTVTFPGKPEDESEYARAVVAAHPGIAWVPREYRPVDFFARADDYVAHMDEPFHSPAMLANQEIWRGMAAAGIKVSLNGGGGDEVLAGYASEYFAPYLVSLLRGGAGKTFLREFTRFSEHDRNRLLLSYGREIFHLLPDAWRARLKPALPPAGEDPLLPGPDALPPRSSSAEGRLLENMGEGKMNYWMRSGNLSCMQVPTEVRLPFLDHRLVDFAFSLPLSFLIRDGWLKWILRESMRGLLPDSVLWRRRKSGFPFPLRGWLEREAPRFRAFALPLDCPYIDGRKLAGNYAALCARHPDYLWRLLSTAMWWRRRVEGKPLALEGA
jgi:asparagine synthase (glutamine-hydrolysing)